MKPLLAVFISSLFVCFMTTSQAEEKKHTLPEKAALFLNMAKEKETLREIIPGEINDNKMEEDEKKERKKHLSKYFPGIPMNYKSMASVTIHPDKLNTINIHFFRTPGELISKLPIFRWNCALYKNIPQAKTDEEIVHTLICGGYMALIISTPELGKNTFPLNEILPLIKKSLMAHK